MLVLNGLEYKNNGLLLSYCIFAYKYVGFSIFIYFVKNILYFKVLVVFYACKMSMLINDSLISNKKFYDTKRSFLLAMSKFVANSMTCATKFIKAVKKQHPLKIFSVSQSEH